MRDALREIIFDDADIVVARASRKSVVAKAKRSSSAKQKDANCLTPLFERLRQLFIEKHWDPRRIFIGLRV